VTPVATDPDALVDRLVVGGVLDEDPETGALATTPGFEATRAVYHDTYADADDDLFHSTVADLFDVDRDDVADVVAEHGVTRDELVAYLSVRSELSDPPASPELAAMAGIVVEAEPASPVPDAWPELRDDTYRGFLADHPDAVLVAFKLHCVPCEAMKRDLDAIEAAIPDGVHYASLDGDEVPEFRREFEVEAAPTTLVFRDGDLVESLRGRVSPERLADVLDDVY
jgi:thiol-disulfide isomerase/thioredoxin